MRHDISVMFLGTGSGGGPSISRNCSSLVMDIVGDGSLWMVDCGEGTTRQFDFQPGQAAQKYRRAKLTNIFITHMHADHTMGIIGLLKNLLGIPKPDLSPSLKVQLFGPVGLRNFVRSIFLMTDTKAMDKYAVHELLRPCELPSAPCTLESLHPNETRGLDIPCGRDGFWRDFTRANGGWGRRDIVVDAGPIEHRVPCLGYVMRESQSENEDQESCHRLRKIVALGDTHSPNAMIPLINSSPGHVALVVHEATDCCIPLNIDPAGRTGRNRTPDSVLKVSIERGHSTPTMAGEFANSVAAERLYLNHIGGRFPASTSLIQRFQDYFRQSVLTEIENQATQAWAHPHHARAVVASDFTRVVIPPVRKYVTEPVLEGVEVDVDVDVSSSLQLNRASFHKAPVMGYARGARSFTTVTASSSFVRGIGHQRIDGRDGKKRSRSDGMRDHTDSGGLSKRSRREKSNQRLRKKIDLD